MTMSALWPMGCVVDDDPPWADSPAPPVVKVDHTEKNLIRLASNKRYRERVARGVIAYERGLRELKERPWTSLDRLERLYITTSMKMTEEMWFGFWYFNFRAKSGRQFDARSLSRRSRDERHLHEIQRYMYAVFSAQCDSSVWLWN